MEYLNPSDARIVLWQRLGQLRKEIVANGGDLRKADDFDLKGYVKSLGDPAKHPNHTTTSFEQRFGSK